MVIGVLLTRAPLLFLTSNLPLSLFTFFFLTIFLPFGVIRSLKMSVPPGGTLTTAAANVTHLRAFADAPGLLPSLRALTRTVRRISLVHEVLVSGQVSRTPQVLAGGAGGAASWARMSDVGVARHPPQERSGADQAQEGHAERLMCPARPGAVIRWGSLAIAC